jgi:biuret amidohydrolase
MPSPLSRSFTVQALPNAISFVPTNTALIIIDMQRDFLEPAGFGAALGNDVNELRHCIAPCVNLLAAARQAGLTIIHTREGHRSDLQDVHREKLARCPPGKQIGDRGPMGRILIRGEAGHDFIPELLPHAGEVIIDKPGKGAFYSTDLDLVLRRQAITTLLICGVTTEVCVHTTVREANDRGYRVIVPGDCCASYFPEFHRVALQMISAQGGIFGYVTEAAALISVLQGVAG